MRRELIAPRADWQREMESIGFHYHTIDGTYWDESRCYVFSESEIDQLESATAELHEMALNAAQQVVGSARYEEFAISNEWIPAIEASWRAYQEQRPEGFTLFGRMDLSYDGVSPPKLLEYNADTPTACLEASVAQWHWLQAVRPGCGSVQLAAREADRSVAGAARIVEQLSGRTRLHFVAVADSAEDWGNRRLSARHRDAGRLADVRAAGRAHRLEWRHLRRRIQCTNRAAVQALSVGMVGAGGFRRVVAVERSEGSLTVIEPAWKMLLSNKALLVVLWELYPEHPNLLPAYYEPAALGSRYVKKPKLAREGANVSLIDGASVQTTDGGYGREGFVYQATASLPRFGDDTMVVGSWIVGEQPAGIGIREDTSPITSNTSRFVPHYFENEETQ